MAQAMERLFATPNTIPTFPSSNDIVIIFRLTPEVAVRNRYQAGKRSIGTNPEDTSKAPEDWRKAEAFGLRQSSGAFSTRYIEDSTPTSLLVSFGPAAAIPSRCSAVHLPPTRRGSEIEAR